jgi:ferredoxin
MPKIIFYRDNCIGCSICQEMQPDLWRMSKKDGKAVLLQSIQKKKIFQLEVHNIFLQQTMEVIEACPARVIKIA